MLERIPESVKVVRYVRPKCSGSKRARWLMNCLRDRGCCDLRRKLSDAVFAPNRLQLIQMKLQLLDLGSLQKTDNRAR
jgi:hypothetical protein